MSPEKTKDELFIEGVRSGDPKIIQHIYTKYHGAITHLVETRGGTKEDAHDVFQEGLVLVFQKTKDASFKLTSSFLTFFYAVCRNIWSNKLRKKGNAQVTHDDNSLLMIQEDSSSALERNEQYFLYRKMFLKLGEDCQKVLDLFLQKISMDEIMQQMGYGSISYTKKRKFLCKERLVKLIQSDPSFKELSMHRNPF